MAYAVKYTGTFDSQGGDHSYTVEILEDGFGGSSTSVEFGSDGRDAVQLTWGQRGDDPHAPLRISEARTAVFDNPNGTVYDDLRASPEDQFRLRIERDSSTYWYGPIILDGLVGSTNQTVETTSFRAIDGLGRLEGIDYADSNGNAFLGRETIVEGVATILSKLDTTDQINTLYTACTWFETSMAESVNPLNQVTFDRRVYRDSDGNATDCLTVLRELCQRFDLQLYQSEGAWWLIQREMTEASYTRWEYDLSGNEVSSGSSFDPLISIASADEYDERLADGRRESKEPYKETSVVYEYGLTPLLENGNFDTWTTSTQAEEWNNVTTTGQQVEDTVYSEPFALNINTAQYITEGDGTPEGGNTDPEDQIGAYVSQSSDEQVSQGDNDRISFRAVPYVTRSDQTQRAFLINVYAQVILDAPAAKVAELNGAISAGDSITSLSVANLTESLDEGDRIYLSEGTGFQTFTVDTDEPSSSTTIDVVNTTARFDFSDGIDIDRPTDSWWLDEDGNWNKNSIQTVSWGERGIPPETWVPLRVTADTVPSDGTITVRLYEPVDRHQFSSPGGTVQTASGIIWDDVSVSYMPAGGVDTTEDTTEAVLQGTDNVRVRDETRLSIGDGPTAAQPNSLLIDGGLTATSDWGRVASASNPLSLDELLAETYLISQDSFIDQHSAGYFRKGFEAYHTLELAGTPLQPTYLSKNLRADNDNGEWVEVVLSGSSPTFEARQEEASSGTLTSEEGGTTQLGFVEEGAFENSTTSPVTTTSDTVGSGAQTSIPINAIGEPIFENGDTLILIDRSRPKVYELTVNADQAPTDTSISIQSFTFDADVPSPSGVYRSENELTSLLVQSDNYINMTARTDKIGDLASSITSGNTVTSLDLDYARAPFRSGEKIYVEEGATQEQFEIAADVSMGDGSIDVVDKTADNSFTTSAVVKDDTGANFIEGSINVLPGTVKISGERIEFNGTMVAGDDLVSDNFDGTIDGSGNLTSTGTTGWAITGQGDAVFNEVTVRNGTFEGFGDSDVTADAVTSDGGTNDSPFLQWAATYDSDPTASVSSAEYQYRQRVDMDTAGSNPEAAMAFWSPNRTAQQFIIGNGRRIGAYDEDETIIEVIHDSGTAGVGDARFSLFAGDASGGNRQELFIAADNDQGESAFISKTTGTASTLPMRFYIDSTIGLEIDTSRNVNVKDGDLQVDGGKVTTSNSTSLTLTSSGTNNRVLVDPGWFKVEDGASLHQRDQGGSGGSPGTPLETRRFGMGTGEQRAGMRIGAYPFTIGGSGGGADGLGTTIVFEGVDSDGNAAEQQTFIGSTWQDATSGAEDGQLQFGGLSGGTGGFWYRMNSGALFPENDGTQDLGGSTNTWSTVHTEQVQSENGTLDINASNSTIDFGSNTLTNVSDPSSAQDAATKNYVDNNSGGASQLNDLSDVSTSAESDGDVLRFNSGTSNYENTALDHSDLTGVGASDHHAKYTDSEAVSAVESHGQLNLSGGIRAAGDLDPDTDQTYNIGDSNNVWSECWVDKIRNDANSLQLFGNLARAKAIASSVVGGDATLELQTEDSSDAITTGLLIRGGGNQDVEIWASSTTQNLNLNQGGSPGNTGDLYITGTLTESHSFSDPDLKTNMRPLQYGLSEVRQLSTMLYDFERGNISNRPGFDADEVAGIMPELVGESYYLGEYHSDIDGLPKADNEKRRTLRNDDVVPILVRAIQQQQEQIEQLQNQ